MFFPAPKKVPSPTGSAGAKAVESGAASVTGSFDPTGLERGAKALRELDGSPNSTRAFEIVKMQEQTKQKEIQLQMEQVMTQRQQYSVDKTKAEGEEKRKSMEVQAEQQKRLAEYQARVDAELNEKKLQDQQRQNEAWLSAQHEQFVRQEELRKRTELEIAEIRKRAAQDQAKVESEVKVAVAKAESEGRTKQERENLDVRLQEMKEKVAANSSASLALFGAVSSSVGGAFSWMFGDKTRATNSIAGISALFLALYSARHGTRMLANVYERRLLTPPLVRDTNRFSLAGTHGWFAAASQQFKRKFMPGAAASSGSVLDQIVLEDSLKEKLQWTVNSIVNARKNKAPLRHMLLYGPPGTGKTLFARTLAKQTGLDYAIMTGGDVGPLGAMAVDEINKLFAWAEKKSKNGLILFIDEADAFLRSGREGTSNELEASGSSSSASVGASSENMRNALSAFLHHTGTENGNFMVVLATNCPQVLDRAVTDRIDDAFEFPLPESKQRVAMLQMFIRKYLSGRMVMDDLISKPDYLEAVSTKLSGFSGRQIAKLVLAWQSAVYGSGSGKLSKGLADLVVQWKLDERNKGVSKSKV